MLFGERDHLAPGIVARHRGADDKGRTSGGAQCLGDLPQQLGVAANGGAQPARRQGLADTVPVIDWDRHEGRSARRLHRGVIGACDRRRDILGPRRLTAPFDVRPREFRRPFGEQEGLERQDRAGLLAGRDHQRRLVLVSGEDAARGVADPGGGVQVYQAGVAGRLRIAVRHADCHHLLQAQHIAEIGRKIAKHRQFR